MQVGHSKLVKPDGKPRKATYKDTVFVNGYADVTKYLPAEDTLVHLLTSDDKDIVGWISNGKWNGLHLSKKHKVVAWKRMERNTEDD